MSLAIKYRPIDFKSIVGQKFVKETLQEAIKKDKLVGAYLFCGPRGTGKTSSARIFAKTINCLKIENGNPCNKCEICTSFMDNNLIDIIEIDAASYTGVDNIRNIIEKAQFLPNIAKYKVYIIDEVHMLSAGAFNALLKILEEPPSFVKFILATTESHKIPETILSRCQRFDFKNISDGDIKERLEFIALNEKINVDQKSLDFIVKNSHGGLRNAITLFEQYISNNEIIFENIINNLGISESSFVDNFLSKLLAKDKSIINDFESIIDSGKNIKLFFKDLIYLLRDRIIENIKNNKKFFELNEVLLILDETYSKTKNSMDEKITLLSGILKILSKGEKLINTIIEGEINKEVKKEKKVEVLEVLKTPENKILSEELDHNDLFEIFGDETASENENSINISFNKELFISKVKELGGKGSLTMGLRGGKIMLNGDVLTITAPSKIALKSLQDIEVNEIIASSLEKLGFNNIKIQIN